MENQLAKKTCAYFQEGFNCSESMLKAYLDVYKKDPKLGAAASGFGGGIAGKGFTCGAVSGAIIAIGLDYDRQSSEDKELYGKVRDNSRELIEQFTEIHGSSNCKDLQPYDLTTMEGREKLHADPEVMVKCKSYLSSAAKLLEKALK
ncbi:MAG: hypothetical protein APF76_17340 [Desulfitibacter sp. BRH_c19]|nr:MAG: hypothetical protein APF76_17340 [Desulfitibacter sp. BRH_c19]